MRPQVHPTLFSWICAARLWLVFPILGGFLFYLHSEVLKLKYPAAVAVVQLMVLILLQLDQQLELVQMTMFLLSLIST